MKNNAKKDQTDNTNIQEAIEHTVVEILYFLLVILTLGIFLFVVRKPRTDKSYIHSFFKPIDSVMYDPALNRLH